MFPRPDRAALALLSFALLAAAPPAGRCAAVHAPTIAARAAADAAAARGDVRGENARLDEALGALGASYATRNMIDDTGMRLVLARSATANGRPKQAAALKRKVLAERLRLCTAG